MGRRVHACVGVEVAIGGRVHVHGVGVWKGQCNVMGRRVQSCMRRCGGDHGGRESAVCMHVEVMN